MAFWGKKDDNEKNTKQSEAPFTLQAQQKDATSSALLAVKTETGPEFSKNDPYGKVRSALGPGTIIQGRLSFDTVVSIDGKLGGEIFSSKALLVGKSGVVDATIDVQVLIVKGIVRGTIRAAERIEIREGGQILGEVTTPVLVMDEGCVFNGSCAMGEGHRPSTTKVASGIRDLKEQDSISIPLTPASVEAEQISVI